MSQRPLKLVGSIYTLSMAVPSHTVYFPLAFACSRARVAQINKRGKEQPRLIVLTDQYIYNFVEYLRGWANANALQKLVKVGQPHSSRRKGQSETSEPHLEPITLPKSNSFHS